MAERVEGLELNCSVCGNRVDVYVAGKPEESFCRECCPEHKYEYIDGCHECKTCAAEPDADWFRCDDDVI